jgi:hypothetical protein
MLADSKEILYSDAFYIVVDGPLERTRWMVYLMSYRNSDEELVFSKSNSNLMNK